MIGRSKQTVHRWEHDPLIEVCLSDAAKCASALRCRLQALLARLDAPIPETRIRRRIKERLAAAAGKRPMQQRQAKSRRGTGDQGRKPLHLTK